MIFQSLNILSRLEKILLVVFATAFVVSGSAIAYRFWLDNTELTPSGGGEYLEGSLERIDENSKINPLLVFGKKGNSIESEIVSLVFAGLMRYNAETGEHENFLADHTLSEDKTLYTFTLKENLKWHDGFTISADDVIFTFRDIIQHPQFENEFLSAAFKDVIIEKIDNRNVSFKIPKPYKFFLTNFTVGLVPRHLLNSTPVENLALDSFNQSPIGAGPFKFEHVSSGSASFTEVRLSKFKDFASQEPKIDFITFRLFQQEKDLLNNLKELDGIRPSLKNESILISDDNRFKEVTFNLPQYVAVFINMEKPLFKGEKGKKMRWALQLATNQEKIIEKVPSKRVDTPLLEVKLENWLSEFDLEKASGALKDSGWYIPGKLPSDEIQEEIEDESALNNIPENNPVHAAATEKWIYSPSSKEIYNTQNDDFYILGRFPAGTVKVLINGYQLQLFSPEKGRWSYKASLKIGTLKYGENIFVAKFYDSKGNLLDEDKINIILSRNAVVSIPEEEVEEIEEEIETEIAEEFTEDNEEVEEVITEETEEEIETETAEEDLAIEEIEEIIPEEAEEIEEEKPKTEEIKKSPIRISEEGEELSMTLVTVDHPKYFPDVAEILRQQWSEVGIDLKVEILDRNSILERIKVRDYDLLLFGQNLGYNPDAFGYWHDSQAETGLNLSEYRNFEASVLLEDIRRTHDEDKRKESLEKLQKIMSEDVPAVFLFSPDYNFRFDSKIKNFNPQKIALFPDRFSNVEKWYIRSEREFQKDISWLSIFKWSYNQVF